MIKQTIVSGATMGVVVFGLWYWLPACHVYRCGSYKKGNLIAE